MRKTIICNILFEILSFFCHFKRPYLQYVPFPMGKTLKKQSAEKFFDCSFSLFSPFFPLFEKGKILPRFSTKKEGLFPLSFFCNFMHKLLHKLNFLHFLCIVWKGAIWEIYSGFCKNFPPFPLKIPPFPCRFCETPPLFISAWKSQALRFFALLKLLFLCRMKATFLCAARSPSACRMKSRFFCAASSPFFAQQWLLFFARQGLILPHFHLKRTAPNHIRPHRFFLENERGFPR